MNSKVESLFVGRELLLTIVLNCLLKKPLTVSLALKVSSKQLSTDSSGVRRILKLFTKAFRF